MFKNLTISLQSITPIFLYLMVGYLSKCLRVVPNEVYSYFNRYCFQVLFGMHMFYNVYSGDFSTPSLLWLIAYLVAFTVFIFLLSGYILNKKVSNAHLRGALWQNTYRSNLAIIGMTLAEVLVGKSGTSIMAVAIAVLGPLFNIFAVISLASCRSEKVCFPSLLKEIVQNPFVRASLIAIPFVVFSIQLPAVIENSIYTLGKTGMTLAMITLGASFDFSSVAKRWKSLLFHSLLRLVAIPAFGLFLAIVLGFRNQELSIVLISLATPLATASYTMAREFDSDYELTGQIVVVTSLLCCFTMFLWIFFLKQLQLI